MATHGVPQMARSGPAARHEPRRWERLEGFPVATKTDAVWLVNEVTAIPCYPMLSHAIPIYLRPNFMLLIWCHLYAVPVVSLTHLTHLAHLTLSWHLLTLNFANFAVAIAARSFFARLKCLAFSCTQIPVLDAWHCRWPNWSPVAKPSKPSNSAKLKSHF